MFWLSLVVSFPVACRPRFRRLGVRRDTAETTRRGSISNFTWHDLRHTFASWLMMKGASLRAVAELLGHRGLRMVMRYAHLSPAYLSVEIGLLDPPAPPRSDKRARKGQRAATHEEPEAKVGEFPKESGSSGRTRTYNPPVNSLVQVFFLVDSSWL
jgi:hypothetical protein